MEKKIRCGGCGPLLCYQHHRSRTLLSAEPADVSWRNVETRISVEQRISGLHSLEAPTPHYYHSYIQAYIRWSLKHDKGKIPHVNLISQSQEPVRANASR